MNNILLNQQMYPINSKDQNNLKLNNNISNRDTSYQRNNNIGKMSMNNITSNNIYNNSNNLNSNNYSLGLFIDNPQNAFIFDEKDLKTLFSHYKGAKSIRILNDKAAAQITFYDQNMIQQVKKDINGLTINDIGTIRCIILNEGKVIEQFLPFSANDPAHLQNSNLSSNNENTVNMLKKLATLLQPQNNTNIKKKNDMNQMTKNQLSNKTNYTNYINSNNNFNPVHNKNDQNENPYANKRLSRIELIDIFGFPSEFDVMKKILGKNNSNITYINEQTNNNVKIEIKGKPINEAPVVERMHISVSSDDIPSYKKGIELVIKLLNSIFKEFCDFCYEKKYPIPDNLAFKKHEYTYNPDGTTKYLGYKEKSHVLKENMKNDYMHKKNKNIQKGEKDKRVPNISYNMYSNSNPQYNNQNMLSGDFKEINYKESNQGNFRNIKLNRTRD
ncbi:conserved Plasmodium protein, unknown function [Plasmodium gallinaceum]|uniref:KHDC4/BBP-like KH-domain type I domain-containing protein n=1 Tax=Plasmodium gallinaceum TaxID=5849 RepID=A0A1J1GSL2_PLAGA|nr:conserved Plasmodium protein, unknown function [Plasmodium gallinaceum]CRG95256.1 conserved Plasmodium protein, unknown function [Plasmodium gallinaceum]